MSQTSRERVLANLREALGREAGAPVAPRPAVVPSRLAGDESAELDLLIQEINKLSGQARRISEAETGPALDQLAAEEGVRKAALWRTPGLEALGIEARLRRLGVEILPDDAGRQAFGACDLGITGVDFALPETGTLGLFSSAEKPRAVSLVPRLHLAIMRPSALRADLHQVFAEAKSRNYLVFITGPSRTADIELTVTLGVHGPQALYLWILV